MSLHNTILCYDHLTKGAGGQTVVHPGGGWARVAKKCPSNMIKWKFDSVELYLISKWHVHLGTYRR